ncbi:hypothetical protein C8R44DRAFT_807709 [Mycena epipterygia]|nr:hypothetical protein C8R44DRAFT_807709 [Mycena epipterygia]
MVKLTCYLVVLSCDVATVEADIDTLVRQVTSFDNAIVAFPPTNGSVDDALAIHADATSIINTLNTAASDTSVPTVLGSLLDIIDKKPAFEALPICGIPALFLQDLRNLQNASVGFGNALINTAPDTLVTNFTDLTSNIAAAFEPAITVYSS